MIKENTVVMEQGCTHHYHRMCWSAVFAGAFVGLGLGFLLHLYGVAIGLSAFSSTTQGASVIAVGGLLGMLIGVIASMAAAGFVAGHLGRHHYCHSHGGVIYGFVTWSLILLMSVVIAGPLMHYAAAYKDSLTNTTMVNGPEVKVTNTAEVNNSNTPILKHDKTTKAPVAEVSPTQLAWGGWIVFGMFFIGAFSCCIGACCGMRCKRHDDMVV